MTVTLTPEQEATLEESVRTGVFGSSQEALDAVICTLRERLANAEAVAELHRKYPTLFHLMKDSPLAGSDIEFPRDKSDWRKLDFS